MARPWAEPLRPSAKPTVEDVPGREKVKEGYVIDARVGTLAEAFEVARKWGLFG